MTAVGAQRKHVTLPTDFRSPSVNGHSCYGHLTARFAPKRPPGPVMDSVPKHGKVPTWHRSGSAWFSSRAHACAAVAGTIAVWSESAAAGEHPYTTRSAIPANGPAIAAIYNEGIADRVVTLETEPRTSRRANGKSRCRATPLDIVRDLKRANAHLLATAYLMLEGRGELLTSRLGQHFE